VKQKWMGHRNSIMAEVRIGKPVSLILNLPLEMMISFLSRVNIKQVNISFNQTSQFSKVLINITAEENTALKTINKMTI
jgi:hypothetical protein